jgi:uncharacterized protein
MSSELPAVPAGNAAHPIALVVISANRLAESTAFYSIVFGWTPMPVSAELTAMAAPSGPGIALRANVPAGFPGMVPYIGVPDVAQALACVIAAGAQVERAPWTVPMVGKLARFSDASGTVYGLTSGVPSGPMPRVEMPLGGNPKPAAATICSIEMYATDGDGAARFFAEQFGWGTLATMPKYMAFDPGAGVGGVFQSHTPALPALPYVYSTDVAATLNAIEAAGGTRTSEAIAMPGMGCFGYFTDPSGTNLGLIGP